jgi:23S rRNA (adenine2503-C2)-methyltransferase
MHIVSSMGRDDVATVFIADMGDNRLVEFVESTQPPLTWNQKWVLIVSVLFGCPVQCMMCDAGDTYRGPLSVDELYAQIDYLVRRRFPDGTVTVPKFKIQFARMGEPAMNPAVLDVLRSIPERYDLASFVPSVSTVAPRGCDPFFEDLLAVKRSLYDDSFQLQFSIHSTEDASRDRLIPVPKWSFAEIAAYGARFRGGNGKKVSLNFALAQDTPLDPHVLRDAFDPEAFLIKVTPLNPTYRAASNHLASYIDPAAAEARYAIVDELRDVGYEVLVSIGDVEENQIGSNCGQFVLRHLDQEAGASPASPRGYDYWSSAPGALSERG